MVAAAAVSAAGITVILLGAFGLLNRALEARAGALPAVVADDKLNAPGAVWMIVRGKSDTASIMFFDADNRASTGTIRAMPALIVEWNDLSIGGAR
jgi:hypothetical protein